jgi:hypothetical protein
MSRKLINGLLVLIATAIVVIIAKDFVGNKAGKNVPNPYEYSVDQFRQVDSSKVLYNEILNFPVGAETLSGIALADSFIVVAAGTQLLQYDMRGKEIFRTTFADTANCITIDKEKNLWIGMRHFVAQYDLNGNLLQRWDSFGERSVITSLAVSGDKVFVADAGNRIVYECDRKGKITMKIGEKNEQKGISGYVIPSPFFDLSLDEEGFLWVVNPGKQRLENYNADGSLRTSWGEPGMKLEGFSGCCNPAEMAIMEDNSFVTSEKGMPRIKLYGQHGELKGVVAPPDKFDVDSYYAPDVTVDAEHRVYALDFDRKQVRIFALK